MRWSGVAPRAWRLGAWRPAAAGRRRPSAGGVDALIKNAVKYSEPCAAIELRARPAPPGGVLIEARGRRLRRSGEGDGSDL